MPTKEQDRSSFALQRINTVYNGAVPDNDANFIVGTPTMILQNGFGQTVAFLLSKATTQPKQKQRFVFDSIQQWTKKRVSSADFGKTELHFLEGISTLESDEYLALQHECLLMLQWLKRYARAFAEPAQGGKTHGQDN